MTSSRISKLLALVTALGTFAAPAIAAAADNDPTVPDTSATELDPNGGGGPTEIVNGNPVEPGEYSFFVRIEADNKVCGGTLIDPEWILTAAHCVDGGVRPGQVTAKFGEYSLSLSYLRSAAVREIRIQPRWTGDPKDGYDEALLRIDRNAINVPVVAVGGPGDNSLWGSGHGATIIGYGRLAATGQSPDVLQEVDTVIRSDGYMDNLYGVVWGWIDWWFDGGLIGAGGSGGTACYGDSGGPLLVRKGATWLQVGIASFVDETFGNQCAEAGAFTELVDGGELAWIANSVPAIKSTWGTCRMMRNGFDLGAGRWTTTYNNNGTGSVQCAFVSGGTPTPRPPSGPAPRVCLRKPWMCPDGPGLGDDDL